MGSPELHSMSRRGFCLCCVGAAFAATVACFARVAGTDKPSALFLKRASEFAKRPPGLGWEPVNSLESK